jgi:hypothetical protein
MAALREELEAALKVSSQSRWQEKTAKIAIGNANKV